MWNKKSGFILTIALAVPLAVTAFPLIESLFATYRSSPDVSEIDPDLMDQHAAYRTSTTSTNTSPYATTTHIVVTQSCDVHFGGECLNVRSGPSSTFPKVKQLRNGIVLPVIDVIETATSTWFQIGLNEHLHYEERVTTDWFVSGEFIQTLDLSATSSPATTTKRIYVDVSDQLLTAYENEEVVMQVRISTGLRETPTPLGNFEVLYKTPSRYMQGPLENGRRVSEEDVPETHPDYYDLPGVPWNLYFTTDGAVIHGAYWHVNFGKPHSHGCVNLPPKDAESMYHWADVGTAISIVP